MSTAILYIQNMSEKHSKLGPLSLLPLPSATCCDPLSSWQDFAALYYPCQVVWGLETSSMLSSTSSSESLMQANINRGALLHPSPFQCHKAGILRILRVAMMIWHFDTARGPIHSSAVKDDLQVIQRSFSFTPGDYVLLNIPSLRWHCNWLIIHLWWQRHWWHDGILIFVVKVVMVSYCDGDVFQEMRCRWWEWWWWWNDRTPCSKTEWHPFTISSPPEVRHYL